MVTAAVSGNLALGVMDVILVVALLLLGGLLKGVLGAAKSIVPRIDAIVGVAAAASKDLDAVVVLLTTQNYISQIVGSVANYGGSLDVALPDA
jgi:hypothetical protein